MKSASSLLFFLFLLLSGTLRAQVATDSLMAKIDSLQVPQMPDTLKATWFAVDSVRNEFNSTADSLVNEYQSVLSPIEKEKAKLQSKIDSLNQVSLPTDKYTQKLDSLKQKQEKALADYNGKVNKLKSKTIGKLDKIEMTPGMQGPVGEFTSQVNGFNPVSEQFKQIPPIKVEGYALPKVQNLNSLRDLPGIDGLPSIDTPMGDLGNLGSEIKGVGADAKNLMKGDIDQMSVVQEQANAHGLSELQEGTSAISEYQENLEAIKSPEAMKEKAVEVAQKKAIDHFAGKEEQLKAAMEQLAKYKKKYNSVPSIQDLPKRPPNAMKGKPFVERLLPGVYLQLNVNHAWLLDVNPYVGYKISGRFLGGAGWNQRFAYQHNTRQWISGERIYGPRVFLDTKLGKGFWVHVESELMNTFVPNNITRPGNEGKRQWVSSTMLGLKKHYKIYKNLSGTVLLQYNLYDKYFKSPYLDRINSRMGFEYTLKRKKVKSK